MNAEKQKLLAELDAARDRLEAALSRLDDQALIYNPWHVKELLDHIAGWDDAVIASLRSHAVGDVPAVTAPRGIDYYNAQTVSTRETLPLDHTRREFSVTRQLLKQLIQDLPDEKFSQALVLPWGRTGTVSEVVEIFVDHELEHAHDLEKIAAEAEAAARQTSAGQAQEN